ncbi:hypothetical protein LTR37_009411 [Vermiconidia calcicola]|uniref:Uncharacterized protein n=1 Tax=Vermiconidia calcicola TaxID=1690605 RepID=A0ACC3N881_9PEZI|nr:hypothetical protein LTR37_009411 [Vermiconidia calcicola]
MSTTTARAIVCSEPGADHIPGTNWQLQDISVPIELKDGELLVEMVASGICHTDLITGSLPPGMPGVQYPRVVGHEGSGYVKAVGPNVTKDVKAGDPVLLSFDYCGQCESCQRGHPAYCAAFFPMNLFGVADVFKSKDGSQGIAGKHFGHSSFASLSVVNQTTVLPAKDLVKSKEELQLFAPLGCGLQTGAGAILNMAKPDKKDRVMVLGLGGVGLAAVMAAKICECEQIIAVDRVKSRIEMSKELGATHGFDTTGVEDLTAAFKEVTGGLGPTVVLDTTGFLPIVQASYDSLGSRGCFVWIGANMDPAYTLNISIGTFMTNGTRMLGCMEGDSVPHEFIPQLIKYYREGKFPIEKIAKYYKAEEFKRALHESHTGESIKPIITW